MALFPVTSIFQVGGRPPSWMISNGHIFGTAHLIHLYSAHRAVIFAIAQLSCLPRYQLVIPVYSSVAASVLKPVIYFR